MEFAPLCFLVLFLLSLGSDYADSKPLPPLPVPKFYITPAEMLKYLDVDTCSMKLPAIYVFGDSLINAGNSLYLNIPSIANYTPYGIDFGEGPTGRPTNGRLVVDFIAQVFGLPFPPPILGLSESLMKTITTGLSFACSSAGISKMPPVLVPILGNILSLDDQIQLFKDTIPMLKDQFDSIECFDSYMSKSLFFINVGGNDLGVYWELGKIHKKSSKVKKYTRQLSKKLQSRLKTLYQLGARKFLFNNVFPFGYQPVNVHLNLKVNKTSFIEHLNKRAASFNKMLPKVMRKLEKSLKGSKFVLFDMYKLFEEVLAQPAAYGFTNVQDSCCIDIAGNQTRACLPNSVPCSDRTTHVFFDPFHPSESIHFLWLRHLLKDNSLCSPMNLLQLIKS